MDLTDFRTKPIATNLSKPSFGLLYQQMDSYLRSLGFTPSLVRVIESAGCGYFDPCVSLHRHSVSF